MADPFIGEIRAFSFVYAPEGWAFCRGQEIDINNNAALYSVIGTYFGGSSNKFKLPNLMGVAPLGIGSGPGLTPVAIGTVGGESSIVLTESDIPAHQHNAQGAINPNAKTLSVASPKDNLFGTYFSTSTGTAMPSYSNLSQPDTMLAPSTLMPAGKNAEHENRQPLLALNFCIALIGEYPIRP